MSILVVPTAVYYYCCIIIIVPELNWDWGQDLYRIEVKIHVAWKLRAGSSLMVQTMRYYRASLTKKQRLTFAWKIKAHKNVLCLQAFERLPWISGSVRGLKGPFLVHWLDIGYNISLSLLLCVRNGCLMFSVSLTALQKFSWDGSPRYCQPPIEYILTNDKSSLWFI